MRSSTIITWMRPSVSCLIWLVTLFVFVGHARVAGATCGDYLSMPKHSIDFVTEQSSVPHETLPQPLTKLPICTGPGCQPHQPIPHQPVSTAITLEAILLPVLPTILPVIELYWGDNVTRLASGLGVRIFRPPRSTYP